MLRHVVSPHDAFHGQARTLRESLFWVDPHSKVHAFPVERESADVGAIRRALRILKEGEVVGIFPEGRRNTQGDVKPATVAVLLAATAKCPLVPVALVGQMSQPGGFVQAMSECASGSH